MIPEIISAMEKLNPMDSSHKKVCIFMDSIKCDLIKTDKQVKTILSQAIDSINTDPDSFNKVFLLDLKI